MFTYIDHTEAFEALCCFSSDIVSFSHSEYVLFLCSKENEILGSDICVWNRICLDRGTAINLVKLLKLTNMKLRKVLVIYI